MVECEEAIAPRAGKETAEKRVQRQVRSLQVLVTGGSGHFVWKGGLYNTWDLASPGACGY